MFEQLAERMKMDDHEAMSSTVRLLRWLVVALISLVVFGSLYYGVRMLD